MGWRLCRIFIRFIALWLLQFQYTNNLNSALNTNLPHQFVQFEVKELFYSDHKLNREKYKKSEFLQLHYEVNSVVCGFAVLLQCITTRLESFPNLWGHPSNSFRQQPSQHTSGKISSTFKTNVAWFHTRTSLEFQFGNLQRPESWAFIGTCGKISFTTERENYNNWSDRPW